MQMIFALVCIAIIAFGALVGFGRRANRALFRLGTLIISVFLSVGFAKWLVKLGADTLLTTVLPQLLDDPDFQAALAENPALTESVSVVLQMLVAPILFLIVYLVAKLATYIVYKIICAIFRIRGPKLLGLGRLAGLVVGVICGLVGVLVLVTPVCGYLNLVSDTVEMLETTDENGESVLPEEFDMILEIKDAPIAGHVYDLLGDKLFTMLTTATWDEEDVVLKDEVAAILSAVDNASELTDSEVADYGDEEVTAIRDVVSGVEQSQLLSHLGSGLLSGASKAWLEDESFMGIAAPETDPDMQGILDAFFLVFSTSDHTNIGGDLTSFADVFAVLVENEILAAINDENADFAAQLTSTDVVSELYTVLDSNERMYPVKIAISDTGMRIMLNQLGSSVDELRETHGELLNDMADALKQVPVNESGEIDKETLTTDINTALETSGVEVDESAVKLVTDGFVDEFTAEELQTLTSDEIIDRLLDRFSGVELKDLPADAIPQ